MYFNILFLRLINGKQVLNKASFLAFHIFCQLLVKLSLTEKN